MCINVHNFDLASSPTLPKTAKKKNWYVFFIYECHSWWKGTYSRNNLIVCSRAQLHTEERQPISIAKSLGPIGTAD